MIVVGVVLVPPAVCGLVFEYHLGPGEALAPTLHSNG